MDNISMIFIVYYQAFFL